MSFSAAGGGVVFADKVTTVSPTYAQEVYKPEFGFGMQVSYPACSHY
jgi:starch synthase